MRTVWCGDFNTHSTLWGCKKNYNNGLLLEELLEERELVCLNYGNKTRIDIRTGKESALDLTLVSKNLASVCDWRVHKDGTIGSDHYPVICKVNISVVEEE